MRENCGVFGYFSNNHDVAKQIYYGNFKLQHRGQRYCGIATSDNVLHLITKKGLVRHTLTETDILSLKGNIGIGHVSLQDRQPIILLSHLGRFSIAFSGNIINRKELAEELKRERHSFSTETDIELLGKLISLESSFSEGIEKLNEKVVGSYALVLLTEKEIYAARDPSGFKPLVIGKNKNDIAVSSESRPFDFLDIKLIRDVKPGEIIKISSKGIESIGKVNGRKISFCAFEWAYIASVDSIIEGIPVIRARENFGVKLAERDGENIKADIVAPVPFSGIGCALGYHKFSKIPYQEVFLIDRFAGRSYTPLTQKERNAEAKIKLSVIKDNVKGKSIVLCDDSIVRGTQIRDKVFELKQAGAVKVHVRIACPPLTAPCRYGISTRSYDELARQKYSIEGIRKSIGADTLRYNILNDFVSAIGIPEEKLCLSCFTGKFQEKI
jgi:amidophosphoribosyltransferase